MTTAIFDNWRGQVLEVLAPSCCQWCGSPGMGAGCAGCRAALPWNEPACRACALPLAPGLATGVCGDCLREAPEQDRTWAAFRYGEPVARQIVRLKFRSRLAPALALGALMAQRLAQRAEPFPELIVPVPLHPGRLRWRGYNQALELARELARRLSIPLAPRAARRVVATREQTRLDAAERRRNLRDAFVVDAAAVRGRHVALLDDVITTGATARALARALRAAGAVRIEAWAAARVV